MHLRRCAGFARQYRERLIVTNIEPVRPEEIQDPELRELIARCERLGVPDALFPRILSRVPADPWLTDR